MGLLVAEFRKNKKVALEQKKAEMIIIIIIIIMVPVTAGAEEWIPICSTKQLN